MYISKLEIKNYRNFTDFEIKFKPLTLIIGENNIGKSNLLNSLGLIFSQDVSIYKKRNLEVSDFNYDCILKYKRDILDNEKSIEEIEFPIIEISATLLDWDTDQESVIGDWYINEELTEAKLKYIYSPVSSFDKLEEIQTLTDIEDYILTKKIENKVKDEEVEYVRNSQFKKVVPRIYNQTCAFTGMRVESLDGYNFIDACHIIPFSKAHNDSITNGIALNPTLHRIFDRGLITVDNKYKMVVSDTFIESKEAEYSIKKLHGKQIILPFGEFYYPEKLNFQWHRENIFK